MANTLPNYGNWVPIPVLLVFFLTWVISLLFSFLPPIPFFLQVLLWTFAGLAFLGFLVMTYIHYHFGKNGNELQNKLRNLVNKRLVWNGEGKALDIGTGNGPLAISLAKKFPKANITGVDSWGMGWGYSKDDCEKNAHIEGVQDRVRFQKANAMTLPFNDGEFDAVVSNFVFHEVRDAKKKCDAIQEALRVLRKGGTFSFQDTFLDKRIYGPLDKLIEIVRESADEVHFESTVKMVNGSKLLKTGPILGKIGILYGTK